MPDWGLLRVLLLGLIGLIAWPVARYVYLYLQSSPDRRDITQPSADASWRSQERLALHLIALAVLAGLAIYIFTPAAEEFARSPNFPSILMVGFGGWALYTVAAGLMKGEIEPFAKGRLGPYSRDGHPVRFWLSTAFNAALGGLMIWLALTQQF